MQLDLTSLSNAGEKVVHKRVFIVGLCIWVLKDSAASANIIALCQLAIAAIYVIAQTVSDRLEDRKNIAH